MEMDTAVIPRRSGFCISVAFEFSLVAFLHMVRASLLYPPSCLLSRETPWHVWAVWVSWRRYVRDGIRLPRRLALIVSL